VQVDQRVRPLDHLAEEGGGEAVGDGALRLAREDPGQVDAVDGRGPGAGLEGGEVDDRDD